MTPGRHDDGRDDDHQDGHDHFRKKQA